MSPLGMGWASSKELDSGLTASISLTIEGYKARMSGSARCVLNASRQQTTLNSRMVPRIRIPSLRAHECREGNGDSSS